MNEEKNLNNRIGKSNPFRVPKDYFESFTPRIMENLPEHTDTIAENTDISLWERVKPWVYMVAMFCGMMFGLRILVSDNHKGKTSDTNATPTILSANDEMMLDEYINSIIGETMMDDYTLYLYLTDYNSISNE